MLPLICQPRERAVAAAPDHQVSLTDPDARAMATNGKGTGMVGYNVQAAVDAKHHLIVAHEVTNIGRDRSQLANMARQVKEATGSNELTILADRGYFSGVEVVACEEVGVTPIVPKPLTYGAKADIASAGKTSSTMPNTTTTPARRVQNSPKSIAVWITQRLRSLPPPERLLHLPAQTSVHTDPAAHHQALGTRGGDRGDAATPG
jgi:hypothetical protein